jgi:hypothetical protein
LIDAMRLKVGVDQDEIGLALSYAWGFSIICAGIVAVPGALLLLFLLILRMRQPKQQHN